MEMLRLNLLRRCPRIPNQKVGNEERKETLQICLMLCIREIKLAQKFCEADFGHMNDLVLNLFLQLICNNTILVYSEHFKDYMILNDSVPYLNSITTIINSSLQSAIFLLELKKVIISPVLKNQNQDTNSLSNY